MSEKKYRFCLGQDPCHCIVHRNVSTVLPLFLIRKLQEAGTPESIMPSRTSPPFTAVFSVLFLSYPWYPD